MILLGILIALLLLASLGAMPFAVYVFARLRRSEQATESLVARIAAIEAAGTPPGGGDAPARPATAEPPERRTPAPPQPAQRAAEPPRPAPPPHLPEMRPRGLERLERGLTAHWFVWLGALALALGSAFLVKYSIDMGLLGPGVRTSLGFILGIALVAGGEWLRRHPQTRPVPGVRADVIPPALVAAGVFACFASVYAAFALYGLLSVFSAFAMLAAVAFAAILLAPLHGIAVGLLGALGAFATPALAPSADPNGWALFSYLGVVTAATLLIARTQRRAWLGYLALVPASLWAAAWLVRSEWGGDVLPAGLYAVATAVLVVITPYCTVRFGARPIALASGYAPSDWPNALIWCALAAAAVLLFAVAAADGFALRSLLLIVLFGGLVLVLAWRNADFEAAPVVAAGLAACIALTFSAGAGPLDLMPRRVLAPGTIRYLVTVGGLGLLFAVGPCLLLSGARRPSLFAGVAAGAPLVLFAIAYARVEAFAQSASWAAASLALAALAVAACARLPRHENETENEIMLGAFAAAATAAIAFAVAVTLRREWLTIALALEVPALAWIYLRTGARPLRIIAGLIAAIVLVRLCLNPRLLDYGTGTHVLWNWLWYGYGVPALAFVAAARAFRWQARDELVAFLEAGAVLLAALLVSLEIHLLIQGSLRAAPGGLLEASLLSLAWLALALVLARARTGLGQAVARHGAALLTAIACADIVLVQLIAENPLRTNAPVGETIAVNLLLLAYGAPAALLPVVVRRLWPGSPGARVADAFALLLAFVEVTLEIRHVFQGSHLAFGSVSDAEWYAYSAAWLVFGAVLLAGGVRFASQPLRVASLIVIVAAVAKVFLFDMAALTGLYRAASFIGLGAALIGVALFYQRVVFARPPPGAAGRGSPGVPDPV